MGMKQNENRESVEADKNFPIGLTFLKLDEKRRSKRWKLLQDFFETNDYASSIGEHTEIFFLLNKTIA